MNIIQKQISDSFSRYSQAAVSCLVKTQTKNRSGNNEKSKSFAYLNIYLMKKRSHYYRYLIIGPAQYFKNRVELV